MNLTQKEQLNEMLDQLISGKSESAAINMHEYLGEKMRESIGVLDEGFKLHVTPDDMRMAKHYIDDDLQPNWDATTPIEMIHFIAAAAKLNALDSPVAKETLKRIAKDGYAAFRYAKDLLKGRFKPGEEAIKQNAQRWKEYQSFVNNISGKDEFPKEDKK